MKKTFTQLAGVCSLVMGLLFSGNASAATYTATSSGAWSSSSTWSGGTAPGNAPTLLDLVIISNGVTVTLDEDVTFNLGASLQVDGSLISGSNDNSLTMNLASITGSGTMDLKRLHFETGSTMTFSGTADIQKMWTSAGSLQLASELNLHDSLFLDAGTLNLASGSSFTLMSGSVLRIDNGIFTATQGIFNSGNAYEIQYVGADKATGIELSGSSISDIYIDLDDNDQELSITGNVTWNGDIHHSAGMINLNGGSLTISGDYESESGAMFMGSATSNLTISSSATMTSDILFDTDNDDLHNLTINLSGAANHADFGNNLTINGTLWLEEGEMAQTGGTLTLAEGSEIVVEDGTMSMSGGGSLSATNNYSVSYTGSASRNSSMELSGSGLSDLMIDLQNEGDSIAVMNDLTLDGMLDLSSGGLGMNGNDLTLDGSLATSSEAWISGDEDSDLTFNTTSLIGDTLWFNPSNHNIGMLTINADDNSDLMIGNDVMAEGMIMSTGGVQIWDNTLWLATTGSVTGASEDRYVMIDGDGSLAMNVQVSAPYMMYPVGTESGYAPVSLQQNSGTAGYFMVGTNDGVWSMGASGDNYATGQSIVDRTWNIESQGGSSFDMNVMAMWDEAMEVNGFDRTDAFMMEYTNGWDYASQTAGEAVAAGDMWTYERENVTSPGRFAIADGSTTLKVNEQSYLVSAVYPNPVATVLTCEIVLDNTTIAQVIDATGKVMLTEEIKSTGSPVNYTIDFSNYTNGIYFVNFENESGTASYRVVKN